MPRLAAHRRVRACVREGGGPEWAALAPHRHGSPGLWFSLLHTRAFGQHGLLPTTPDVLPPTGPVPVPVPPRLVCACLPFVSLAGMNPVGSRAGQGEFVAAFAATNLGDVSPNINGSFCVDTGLPCEMSHSTCKGKNELCQARGPGQDMFDSTRIIAERQDATAKEMWENELAQQELGGPVDMRHTWVDMTKLTFNSTGGETLHTCEPAMGYAFAAGTTDGPGAFDFTQGTNSSNPFWNTISRLISKPSPQDVACHAPKPILLNLGPITVPYPWAARVVPLQLVRLGRLFLCTLPTELTTMAGRRLRAAVSKVITESGMEQQPVVVIAGLANEYADYTTTFEEYQAQRYEAASTAYGPNELEAWISVMRRLTEDMAAGRETATEPVPDTYLDKMVELRPGVLFDSVEIGHSYGEVTQQPGATARRGTRVGATFRSANPRDEPGCPMSPPLACASAVPCPPPRPCGTPNPTRMCQRPASDSRAHPTGRFETTHAHAHTHTD